MCWSLLLTQYFLRERIVSGALSFLIIVACVNVSEHSLTALLGISGIKLFGRPNIYQIILQCDLQVLFRKMNNRVPLLGEINLTSLNFVEEGTHRPFYKNGSFQLGKYQQC